LRAAGAAALALALVLVFVSAAQAALVFKRPDGSVMRFPGAPKVWCGAWSADSDRPSIHVQLLTRRQEWELSAVQSEVEAGQRIIFPNDFIFSKPYGALLFAFQRRPVIEASSAEEEASGSLVFTQASCAIGGTVSFTVHAVLGSELFEGTKVRVNGTFTGTVGEEPPTHPRI
jgi:hypothetical protein